MTELIFEAKELPEGGFTARALGQDIFTEADNLSDLKLAIQEAILCHFDQGEAQVCAVTRKPMH